MAEPRAVTKLVTINWFTTRGYEEVEVSAVEQLMTHLPEDRPGTLGAVGEAEVRRLLHGYSVHAGCGACSWKVAMKRSTTEDGGHASKPVQMTGIGWATDGRNELYKVTSVREGVTAHTSSWSSNLASDGKDTRSTVALRTLWRANVKQECTASPLCSWLAANAKTGAVTRGAGHALDAKKLRTLVQNFELSQTATAKSWRTGARNWSIRARGALGRKKRLLQYKAHSAGWGAPRARHGDGAYWGANAEELLPTEEIGAALLDSYHQVRESDSFGSANADNKVGSLGRGSARHVHWLCPSPCANSSTPPPLHPSTPPPVPRTLSPRCLH